MCGLPFGGHGVWDSARKIPFNCRLWSAVIPGLCPADRWTSGPEHIEGQAPKPQVKPGPPPTFPRFQGLGEVSTFNWALKNCCSRTERTKTKAKPLGKQRGRPYKTSLNANSGGAIPRELIKASC
jgi:hypothetical protein